MSFFSNPSDSVDHDSPNTSYAATSVTPWSFSSQEEARAFHRYVHSISTELDIGDPEAHFSRYLPLQAIKSPAITHAILAFAFKHESSTSASGGDDSAAVMHYTKCMQHLIPLLDNPVSELDDEVLATVLLLRKYEEFEDEDTRTHLMAIARLTLLATRLSSLARSGGLREAASWISLRQDLYFSLTRQQPPAIDLDCYLGSKMLSSNSPEASANQSFLIFAHVLNFAFADSECFANRAEMKVQWRKLDEAAENWYKSRPDHAQPLWTFGDHENKGNKNAFEYPQVLMCHPAHVAALQYYYLSKLVLVLYDPGLPCAGLGFKHARDGAEKKMSKYLGLVVGLAKSNPQVFNAGFSACHILVACESYISMQRERTAALSFIEEVRPRIGWPPTKLMNRLRWRWGAM